MMSRPRGDSARARVAFSYSRRLEAAGAEPKNASIAAQNLAEVELLGTTLPSDVTTPGDPLVASSSNMPGSEGVANAIDNTDAKYLNFDALRMSMPFLHNAVLKMPPVAPQKRSVWPWLLGIGAVLVFLGIGLVILIFAIAKITNATGLRHLEPSRRCAARHLPEQRNLHCQGQLRLQVPVSGHTPEHEAARERPQRQFARQVVDYLRSVMLVRLGNADQVDATPEMRARMVAHAQGLEMHRLLEMIRLFNNAAITARRGPRRAHPFPGR